MPAIVITRKESSALSSGIGSENALVELELTSVVTCDSAGFEVEVRLACKSSSATYFLQYSSDCH